MKLYLVTFDLDNTQFLVDAKNGTEAIKDAIIANQDIDLLGQYNDYDLPDMKKITNYYEETVDMSLLAEVMKRNDCLGKSNLLDNVIVFNG